MLLRNRRGKGETDMADVAEQAAELELPASPASLASSMRSSSSVKRQKAEANLEMARRLMAIEEADAQERLDRQRRVLQLELEARHAQIDSTSSSRSRRSSRPASSAPTQHLRPLLASSTTRSAASLISSGQENKVEVSSSQPRLETVCKLPGKSALTATRHWVETQKPVTAHATFAPVAAGTTATKPAQESPEAGGLHPAQAANGMQKFLIRQTVGRDLPAFSGDSEEWPIFASTYQRTSDECGFSPSENVIRLQRCLKGPAKAAVGAMLTVPENLPTVLQVLESRFGRPDAVIAAMIGKAKAIGQVKPGDFDSLINLSTAVTTLVTTMEHLRSEGHMYNPQLRQELVGRLPTSLRLQWGEVLVRQGSHDISLRVFSLWLADKAEAAVRVVDLPGTRTDKTQRVYSHQEVSTVYSTAAATAPASATSKTQSACLCCKQVQHALSKCSTFTKLGQKARFELVKRHRLCFSCLASGHATRECGSRKQCSEPDCKYYHHVLLHKGKAAEKPVDTCGHTGIPGTTRVLLRVLPVTVSGPKGCVETLALLDEASTVTLMDKALADDIGAVGQSDPLHMAWTNSTTHTDNSSCRVSVSVNGSDGTQHQMDDVRTAKDLKLHSQSIDGRGLASRWPHLDDSRVASYPAVQPRMLIGQDNGHLTVAREVVEGPPNAPMLTRTLLGWVVHGRIGARTHQDQLEPEAIYHISQPTSDECIDTTEVKKEFVAATTSPPRPQQIAEALPDVNRFSSWKRLICTTAYVARFIANTRARVRGQTVGSTAAISAKEMDAAEQLWMKSVQAECFAEEVALLSDGQPVSTSSRLRQLAPAIDEDGILRVQGRLTHATEMTYSAKHPAILCPKHRYTQLLVHEYHLRSGHHGHERTLNELRQQYWVTTGRAAVKRAWSECQCCKNQRANPKPPVMGNLPVQRLTPFLRPFTFTGLDYFGPLHIKIGRRRELRYGALFTCLSTRAVHLEVAHSLNTDSAIMAIRRMCARRGCPQEIHSDNGTNFRGADRELKAALEDFRQDRLAAECSSKGISWHFNPPLAPHMGGSWERLVRAVKIAMKSVMKERVVTEEVLATVFAEAEQLVNSRPLTHVSVDPDDEESLTPNHFLIGSSSATSRPGVFVDADLCLRKHWRIAQKITDEFWKRWILEYRPELTRRRKWQDGTPSLAVGDVVVVVDSNQPRGQWPRGRLEAVHPGSDGIVRVADVRTKSGLYRRPVVKLAKLDVLR